MGKREKYVYKVYRFFVVIFHKNVCAVSTNIRRKKEMMRNDGDYTCHIWMWITCSRVSKSYYSSLKRTRGKYENQTSGNVLWKREEMS